MSKTYAQIQKQIDALTKEAEKLKRQEVEGVIARIREAIEIYNLSAADLGLRPSGPRVAATRGRKRGAAKTAGKVKYRDEGGNVWGGRGPRPLWLREALANGKKLEDFAV